MADTTRLRLDYNGIASRKEIYALQQKLNALHRSMEIRELGLNKAHVSFEHGAVTTDALREAVAQAGGQVQNVHPE